MKLFLQFLLVLSFVYCECSAESINPISKRSQALLPDNPSKIVGGQPATPGQFPYQVSIVLRKSNRFGCGGSILDEWHILTAGHCTKAVGSHNISIYAGSLTANVTNGEGQLIPVASYVQHPDLNSDVRHNNDISILKLSSPIILGPGISPVSLPTDNEDPAEGTMATVSGYGRLSEEGELPATLQFVDVPVISWSSCQSSYGAENVNDNMICAGYLEGGKDSCEGDSGGPLVVKNDVADSLYVQIGIVSWGKGCARPEYYGVYTKVGNYISWIREVMEQ